MLRLERKQRKIVIRARKRDRFLTRGFLVSLTIAMLLHGTAFFVFHITASDYTGSSSSAPPAIILADTEDGRNHALSDLEEHLHFYDLEPKPPLLSLPVAALSFEPPFSAPPEPLPLSSDPLPLPVTLQLPSAQVEIFGPLGAVRAPEIPSGTISINAPATYTCTTYDVRVDMDSGMIFWIRPLAAPTSKKMDKAARELLKALRFHDPAHEGIVPGTICVAFLE